MTLGPFPTKDAPPVWLPEQDAETTGRPWRDIGGVQRFAASILSTMMNWRDTAQSALPGYRGRIAHVRLAGHEGGTNLFMLPETILTLAERGRAAGELLRTRFTADDDADTDRYRWIRMRLAMREFQQLSGQARQRAPLYEDLAENFPIPPDLHSWFDTPPKGTDPFATDIALTLDGLGNLVPGPFDGEPPVDPDLRLSPPE